MISNSGLSGKLKKKHMKELAAYRDNTLIHNPQLRSLFFELTVLCNEHCRHCGSKCGDVFEDNPLSTEEWKNILENVKSEFDISKMALCVTGGEPLLNPDFFEIMNYAKDLGFRWGMTSNGTLITNEVAAKLKNAGMRTISVSVDGLRDTHDWFRESPGSYEKTLQGIRNLLAEGFEHVQITTVVHHRNFSELEEMYGKFLNLGVRSWRVINIEPIGRAKDNSELMLTASEYRELISFIRKHRFKDKRMEVTYGCSHYLGVEEEREVRPWYFLCNAGLYVAAIQNNGNITACLDIERRPELVQGNIRIDSLRDIWETRFEIFRTEYRKTGPCKDCSEYEFCKGDSFHTWNFDRMEPELCMYKSLNKKEELN